MASSNEPGNNMVSLQQVKDWLGIAQTNTDNDSLIQLLVSSFSQYVINRTGRPSFNSVSQYIDTIDGNGNSRIFVRNPPIVDLILATAGSFVFPISSTNATAGIFVEDSGKSIAFRSQWGTGYPANYPPGSIYPYYFPPGIGNIQITYTGGYLAVPYDMQEICMEEIAILYARKDWKDLASKALAAGGGVTGTTTYRSWHLTPRSEMIVQFYQRYARP
jgi:gp6-like head-tail connector protein